MHLTTSPLDWYVARAAGVAAYLLLTVVVTLGMTMAERPAAEALAEVRARGRAPFRGLLVGSFVTIHVVTIALDAYLPFSLSAILVPFAASYRTVYTALGVVAAELLLALAVTNRYRARLPYAFWRRAHYLNLAVWTAATVHGLGSGTDRSTPWLLALFAASVATVLGAGAWRLRRRPGAPWGARCRGSRPLSCSPPPARSPSRRSPGTRATSGRRSRARSCRTSARPAGSSRRPPPHAAPSARSLRADLLIEPSRLDATSFQLELLPSGCSAPAT